MTQSSSQPKSPQSRCPSLDLQVYKGPRFEREGKLDIRPHFKSTNLFQYLHFSSSHPRSIFSGIVKGELTRILRNSTDEHAYRDATDLLIDKFGQRGYPKKHLLQTRGEIPFTNRLEALKDKEQNSERTLPFVCQYTDVVPRRTLRQIMD